MFSHLGKRVGVLYGGPSSEHDVSIETAKSIFANFPADFYPIPIFISKDGEWFINNEKISQRDAPFLFDVAMNAMHGEYGEDGQIQEILDGLGIPYTGSKAHPSRVAMNKALTKDMLRVQGIKSPIHKVLEKDNTTENKISEIFKTFPLPVIVKPLDRGSSIGVSIARNFFELKEGIERAFLSSPNILVEEFIQGKEASCSVLENCKGENIVAFTPIEIIPPSHKDFFDYEAKYGGISEERCPGSFSENESTLIKEFSKNIHKALGLSHYSRSDFIIHPKRGIYFLEVNTLPGITKESLLPKSLLQDGFDLSSFLSHIIDLALNDKKHRK